MTDIADCKVGTKVAVLADGRRKFGIIAGRRVNGIVEGEMGALAQGADETSDMVHVLVEVEDTVGVWLTTRMTLYPDSVEIVS